MKIKSIRNVYQLKISLLNAKPPIWRRILVPGTINLGDLHTVLQIVMGWTDSHLHQFIANNKFYGIQDEGLDFDMEIEDESQYKISELLKKEKRTIAYEYDFGDSWRHNIVLEKILPFENDKELPVCVTGKRACPPEDCGGIWGYTELLQILKDSSHPEHHEMLDWLGGEFDSEKFDVNETNAVLAERCRS